MDMLNVKNRMLNFAKWVLFILVSILVFAAFASFAWFSTETGRVWSTEKALALLSNDDELKITHENIRSDSLGQFSAHQIKVYQKGAPFIFIENIKLVWKPIALLSGNIIVDSLTADSTKIFKPVAEASEQDSTLDTPLTLPDGFSLPDLNLKTLHIRRLSLMGFTENPRLSEFTEAELKIKARTRSDNALDLKAWVRSQNRPPFELQIKGDQNADQRYTFSLQAKEDTPGVFSDLLELPENENFEVALKLIAFYQGDAIVASLETLRFPLSARNIEASGDIKINKQLEPLSIYSELTIDVDDTTHTLIGKSIEDNFDYTLRINAFPLDILEPWIDDFDNGELSASLEISGPVNTLKASGELSANINYKSAVISAELMAVLANETVTLKQATLNLDSSEFNAQGKVFLDKKTVAITARGSHLSLADAKKLELEEFGINIPRDLSFNVSRISANLRGPWQRPLGDVVFSSQGAYHDIPFSAEGELTHSSEALHIQRFTLRSSDSDAQVVGKLNIDSLDANLAVKANNLPISLVETFGLALPEGFSALISADLKLKDSLTSPHAMGEVLVDGKFNDIPLALDVAGQVRNKTLELKKAKLRSNDKALLSATGKYGDKQFDIDLQIDELSTSLFESLGWRPYPGKISANMALNGSTAAPKLHGTASYTTQTTIINNQNHNQVVPISAALDIATNAQELRLNANFLRESIPSGDLSITVPIDIINNIPEKLSSPQNASGNGNLAIAATVNGSIDLKALSYLALSDVNRLDGVLATKTNIDGTISKPQVDGLLLIKDGYFENTISGTVARDIQCSIVSKNSFFKLDKCQARDRESGQLTLAGKFEIPLDNDALSRTPQETIDLALTLNSFNPVDQPDIEAELSGKIDARGDFDKLYVFGDLELSPLDIDISANYEGDIPSIKVKEVHDMSELDNENYVPAPMRPEIFLELAVNTENRAYLRGRGIEMELGGNIKISGKANDIEYDGKFETLRGNAEIFGKMFEVTRGEVRIVDSQFSLLLNAQYEKFGQRIEAEITGTNEDLNLSLSSTPSMAEDEILAFILFGKSVAKMSPFEAVQLAGAVQKLRGGKSFFDPIGSAREILDVDTLSISTEETDSGESGVNIGIGKYLNERVYLEFERTPNPSQPWRGRLEIQLLPNLVLESSTGGKTGIEGAQLKWKRDY